MQEYMKEFFSNNPMYKKTQNLYKDSLSIIKNSILMEKILKITVKKLMISCYFA